MYENIDHKTVIGFGDEWSRFDQSEMPHDELQSLFDSYFSVFPWEDLPDDPVGFDLGCGSGRWAQKVLPKVKQLHCIDPSDAIDVARANLAAFPNAVFHRAPAHAIPVADASMDFGYSLGVLHHIPNTQKAMIDCVGKLKSGAPFLVYLYYRFDNRPAWFRALWKVSDVIRRVVSAMPHSIRYPISQIIAFAIYLPLSRTARFFEAVGCKVDGHWLLIVI
jgi:SAM-dependent methyltransferase